ncbi:four helix bundle protein [Hydrogenimonas thermophila]|uniref:four helix bundle protein n=1 Tax=Hydrogenimonas thermophila TaxID=223786 RepID=UPI002936FCE2|nr:four helix bundle protein [Hydrogenimonas thermophila]WOE69457.1 four helix bundle protein [Hydrogenimonas thermophila]WOE71968.1 four helix bundle protein [Hydrogenimonas thermophila]
MMDERSENLILEKSYQFSLIIIELYKFLTEKKREYIISKQLLRCGTSIGANVNEAQAAISKRDFISKMSIASKEARETLYWLCLLKDSHFIDPEKQKVKNLFNEINSIINIITKIVKSGQVSEK